MQMFLSVLGDRQQRVSIANHAHGRQYRSLNVPPTLYQTNLRITNHRQKTKTSTVIYTPFIQMASRLTATTSFPRVFFQLLQFSKQRPSFSAHRAALMTKTDLIFPTFSSTFLNFAVQFCIRCEFSFHEERRSSQV